MRLAGQGGVGLIRRSVADAIGGGTQLEKVDVRSIQSSTSNKRELFKPPSPAI